MVEKKSGKYDELADFDPANPPKPRGKASVEPEKPRTSTRSIVILAACIVILAGVLWYYFAPKSGPQGLVAYTPGSAAISLVGPEIKALGQLEGPYVVLEVLSPTRVTIASQSHPAEPVELIGLDSGDYTPQAHLALLKPEQLAEREKKLSEMNQYRAAAIKTYCGSKTHFLLRMAPASPDRPSPVYLIQRDANQPDTRGAVVNAQMVRDGKATIDLAGPYHPLLQRMTDCQLAAYAQAKKARDAKRDLDSIWIKYDLPFALTPDQRDRLAVIEPTVY